MYYTETMHGSDFLSAFGGRRAAAALVVLALALPALVFVSRQGERDELDLRGQSSISIVLTEEGFKPRYVRVRKGTEVVFSTSREVPFWPASSHHPWHTLYPEFDPKRSVAPNETWAFTFERIGEWGFHDHTHSYYTGMIYVEDLK